MLFFDFMVEGILIQLGNQWVFVVGQIMDKIFDMVCKFWEQDQDILIILMGYYNLIYVCDLKKFVYVVKDVGVDGFIVVDILVEVDDELCLLVFDVGLNFICFVILMIDDKWLFVVLVNMFGFVYYVFVIGIIGVNIVDIGWVIEVVNWIKGYMDLLVVVGFGVKMVD